MKRLWLNVLNAVFLALVGSEWMVTPSGHPGTPGRVGRAVLPLAMTGYAIGLVVWFVRKCVSTERARREEDRSRHGFCRACCYDLRGSPTRCPECGTPVPEGP